MLGVGPWCLGFGVRSTDHSGLVAATALGAVMAATQAAIATTDKARLTTSTPLRHGAEPGALWPTHTTAYVWDDRRDASSFASRFVP